MREVYRPRQLRIRARSDICLKPEFQADCWLGDFANTISNTSKPAPTTIALSATLKAGH
jgi:hypothetical protein